MTRTIVIIGGVAGGMSAATRLRRLDEEARIVVLERSGYVSFANCGLPYHVGGVIEERSALLLQTPESLGARFNLDVRTGHEVLSIDTAAHELTFRGPDGEGTLAYDALVLSPGAAPVRPPIPGLQRALSLRDIDDTDAMVAALTRAPRAAVVIGGGFIGLEAAENLARRGLDVTVVEAAPQVMAPLDPEMAIRVRRRLEEHGITVRTGATVTQVGADTVTLAGGEDLPADLVVSAIGVRPESRLAAEAGIALGPLGGIAVDENLMTSAPDVYAVGDAVEKVDALTGEPTLVPLANTANLHGRTVADVIAGRTRRARATSGTAIVGVFGLAAAATGWNEKRLRAAGRPYRAIHTHPANHAGYYPGATPLALKLLVDPETDAILGAQAVGEEGVDKRIDVIATAMAGGLTASQLAELELCYAPQFGSAKDPVNMLGMVAENRAGDLADGLQWHELADRQAQGWPVLDVRTPAEFARGAIQGAVNIPVDELRDRLAEVPVGDDVVVHCAVGVRAHVAARVLAAHGRRAWNLDGGYTTWRDGMDAERD